MLQYVVFQAIFIIQLTIFAVKQQQEIQWSMIDQFQVSFTN